MHHSIFTNVNAAEPVACEHSRAAILLKISYVGSQLNNNVDRIDHSKCFYLQSLATTEEPEQMACKRTTQKQVTDKKSERRVLTQTVN